MSVKKSFLLLLLLSVATFPMFSEGLASNFEIMLHKIGESKIQFCDASNGVLDPSKEINEIVFPSYTSPSSGNYVNQIQFGIVVEMYPANGSSSTQNLNLTLVFSGDRNYAEDNGMLIGAKLPEGSDVPIKLNYDVQVDSVDKINISSNLANNLTRGLSLQERSISLLPQAEEITTSGLKEDFLCTLIIKEGSSADEMIMDNIYSGLVILLVDVV